ncbi:GntR family transcriptional regulator [Dactylosporangium sp. CA-092794]|uniref:GntR family transcriptional regulator n=1 Tax=Dactylosporangium sp. CA-092794 TaxID=3239929 RepID=UPI003D8A562A
MIDHYGDRPVYKQLADILRDQIYSGAVPPGKQLPSDLYLSQMHRLGRGTVRRAVEVLQNEGLVTRDKGQRATVREQSPRDVVLLEPGDEVSGRMPNDAERRSLGLPVGEPILEVRRRGGYVDVFPGAATTLRVPSAED